MSKKAFFLVVFILGTASICHAGASTHLGINDAVPGPRLLFPRTDEVSIPSSGDVVFKWDPHEVVSFESSICEIRVYTGNYKLAAALIYKAECDGRKHTILIPSDLFKDGETYTWALRKNYISKGRTLWSLQTFKVIKEKSGAQ